ncbi:MAG: metalloregulator ArsR/SmtB family transcription factor [Planctomycetota bacterium]
MLNLGSCTDLCRLLGDPTRVRLLSLLGEEELTVAELTRITRVTQSRVSTHLGKLREAGLVRDRRDGNHCFYRIDLAGMPPQARAFWETLQHTTDDPLIDEDLARVSTVVQSRNGGSRAESVAGRMHRHYSPGRTWESGSRALLGLTRLGRVLDVASGDGVLTELIAPRAQSVTCLDHSPKVIGAARKRLHRVPNVTFAVGDMHQLPFSDNSFEQVILLNALTYANNPTQVIDEVARVLTPAGRLVASTLKKHKHREEVRRYNHVVCGFEPQKLRQLLESRGLRVDLCDETCRESRKPHFEIVTIHASRAEHPRKGQIV